MKNWALVEKVLTRIICVYVDTEKMLSIRLFEKYGLRIKPWRIMSKGIYRLVFVKLKKKDTLAFTNAMADLRKMAYMSGCRGYDETSSEIMTTLGLIQQEEFI